MGEDLFGNMLYALYGDNSIESDELGNLFVTSPWGTPYYTTAAGTKGDWLLRQKGDSIVVRNGDGIPFARFGGDWYISSLPQTDPVSSNEVDATANTVSEQNDNNEPNDAVWYDQQWRELRVANPNWTDQQVYDEMTRQINKANDANIEAPQDVIAPNNPVFIDAELSDEDIRNGYTLEYNANGIKWRVNAAGRPHPDDLCKFYEQQKIQQAYSDNLVAKFSMIFGTPAAGNDVEVVATRLSQGSSNAGKLLGSLDGLTSAERTVVGELVSKGKNVEIIAKTTESKTPDFLVNGVKTELKSLENLNLNTAITRIQKGFKQGAEVVIIDGRQAGLTIKDAEQVLTRAAGTYESKALPGQVEIWTIEGIVRR